MSNDKLVEKLGFSEELGLTSKTVDSKTKLLENPNFANLGTGKGSKAERERTTEEATFNVDEVVNLAKTSLDFLGALAAPNAFTFCFPPVFMSAWIWVLSYIHKTRDFSQLALGLPRGFGKTSVVKLIVLYAILFTDKKFILVISNTAGLAKNIIADVADMLDEPNIKSVFGNWRMGIETDTQELKKFGFRGRNIILASVGASGSIRGLNIKHARPDIMVFEDIQSREEAESQVISEALEQWMIGTAMKGKDPKGCLFLFIANMYPTKWSILRKLKNNPNWVKFIAGGILADGTSLWEELQPVEQLIKEYENDAKAGRPDIFYAEVLNDENASINVNIDLSKLPQYTIPEDEISAGNFIIIDPSGKKTTSDNTAIGYFDVHDGLPVLKELTNKILSPGDTIRVAIEYALRHNCRLICIEAVAYQASLCYWFNFICAQLGISGIEVVELYPGGYSKNSRILGMFKQYIAGEIKVHPSIQAEVHIEMTGFNALRTDNTDNILDLLTYSHKVLEMFGEYVSSSSILGMQQSKAIGVLEFNSPF